MTGSMVEPDVAGTAIEGVLSIDKPAGPTSHDMVARARRVLGTRRVGHTGTLDPFASGLLLLCIGRATRIAEYLTGLDKRYSAVIRLGVGTDTDDATGSVVAEHSTDAVTLSDIEAALAMQRGEIRQVPSTYSAKKVDGERAYALARQGRAVTLAPVTVNIHRLSITGFALPDVHIDVTCSSGTYIRAIARDLGSALGIAAHLTALRRTAIGPYDVEDAVALDTADADPVALRAALIPALDALGPMPRLELSEGDIAAIRHGRALARAVDEEGTVALEAGGELVAIAEAADGWIRPRKVFL